MGFLCFGSSVIMCLLAMDVRGAGVQLPAVPGTAAAPEQRDSGLESPREAVVPCGIPSTARAPQGEPWWGQTSLQLRPAAAHQLPQLVWEGKRTQSWAQQLTAGLGLPSWVHQLLCWGFWCATPAREGRELEEGPSISSGSESFKLGLKF